MTAPNRRPDEDQPTRRRARVAGYRDRARRNLEQGARARTAAADRPAQPGQADPPPMPGAAVATAVDGSEPDGLDLPTSAAASKPASDALLEPAGPAARVYQTAAPTGRPFRSGWPLTVGLLLLAALVALGSTVALLAVKARHQTATDRARSAALAAARTQAQVFLSYDYRNLDQDFARAEAGLTGSFAKEYAKTTETVVRPTATQYQAVVQAQVISLGVVEADPDRVVVIAFVDQTTTSTRLAGPKVDQNRVEMTLVPVKGAWKVSAVQAL